MILEEGNQHHPWFPQSDVFVPQEALNRDHLTSAMCRQRTERDLWRLVVEEMKDRMGRIFLVYGTPLMAVS